ncbi:MAG: response regulator transcription factor [Spirochaetales bacterium]|nr:response regulator transcription factor [Spirochaetales bacterium]
MIHIVIADDHPLFRKGVQKILDTTHELRITGEAGDGCELMQTLSRLKNIDLLLLDISMPGASGIELIEQVHAVRPRLPVLVVSMHEEEQYALRALKSGCRGYVVKSGSPEELIGAIRTVLRGDRYISARIAQNLAEYLARDAKKEPHENLSNREYDILCRIARGETVGGIASALNVSVKTVSTYKARICQKLHCKTNVELARYAIDKKLI